MMKFNMYPLLIGIIGSALVSCNRQNKAHDPVQEYAFNDNHWRIENPDGSGDSLKLVDHQGRQAIMLEPAQKAFLKESGFEDFVVEFHCNGQTPGVGFRVQDPRNYEYLYLRTFLGGNRDALQYTPIHHGNLPWQLYNYPQYEGKATYPRREVATIPLSFEDQLVNGKASDSLLTALGNKGVVFSEESFVDTPDGSPAYIYDPASSEALLFEKREEGIAFLDYRTWVHVKAEVLGNKMSVFVDDMEAPTFVVDDLKHETRAGGINLYSTFGEVYFSDFSIAEIKSDQTRSSDTDVAQIGPNYITKWYISEMFAKDSVNFPQQADSLLKLRDKFKEINADNDGLVNISRFYDDMDNTIVLTSQIVSDAEKEVELHFDYADHLVVLLNSETLFDGGMDFRPPPNKGAEGRVFVQDERTTLKLRQGVNWLSFMLSGDNRQKFNWGCIAKLEHLDGISLE
ncbi:hypothetical protein ABV409_06725 [Flagellimonas sp. DF-77]|uniref:hypothetical protein n=1 Tax=Flagellimonas algarum TaxID=3230298 RepID=UPI003394CF89